VEISGSVGVDGDNLAADVEIVQSLLNKSGASLKLDRNCGRITIGAICNFQRQFLQQPDGLIEPGGTTFGKLVSGKVRIANPWALLPADSYHYNYCGANEDPRDRQWGTAKTILTIQAIGKAFYLKHSIKIGVGDISLAQGGQMNGHTTGHRIGKNVDIRPIRKDKSPIGVKVTDVQYDKEKSLALAKIIEGFTNVRKVLFGDTYVYDNTGDKVQLEQTKHHNHFHVEMVE
jgi:hypothetical protein